MYLNQCFSSNREAAFEKLLLFVPLWFALRVRLGTRELRFPSDETDLKGAAPLHLMCSSRKYIHSVGGRTEAHLKFKNSKTRTQWLPCFQHLLFQQICCCSAVLANLVLAFMFSGGCLYSPPREQNCRVLGCI